MECFNLSQLLFTNKCGIVLNGVIVVLFKLVVLVGLRVEGPVPDLVSASLDQCPLAELSRAQHLVLESRCGHEKLVRVHDPRHAQTQAIVGLAVVQHADLLGQLPQCIGEGLVEVHDGAVAEDRLDACVGLERECTQLVIDLQFYREVIRVRHLDRVLNNIACQ